MPSFLPALELIRSKSLIDSYCFTFRYDEGNMSGGGLSESTRVTTPPLPGSPSTGERCTLKVHLPDGRFNIVRYNEASDVKVNEIKKKITKLLTSGEYSRA